MSRIIGLCGLAGTGKTTVAGILEGRHGYARVAFADPLKDMLKAVGFTHEQLYGSEKEDMVPDIGVTPRHAMQTLGTEWGRDCIGDRFWIKLWQRKVQSLLVKGIDVVCDDIRFPNEAAAVRGMGGEVWAVYRPTGSLDALPEARHSSECSFALIDPSRHLYNTSDTEALRLRVGTMLQVPVC